MNNPVMSYGMRDFLLADNGLLSFRKIFKSIGLYLGNKIADDYGKVPSKKWENGKI